MDLRKLRYFVAVAEELNFSRAADRLAISQPPLSTQIKQLEAELGVQLLERSSREVRLTVPGIEFLGRARAILEQLEAAMLSTRRSAIGGPVEIRLGLVGSALYSAIPSLTAHIQSVLPQAAISLVELGSAEQLSAVARDSIDIGLMHAPVESPLVESRLVSLEPYALVVPAGHRLAGTRDVRLADCADEPFLCFSRELSPVLFDNVIVACRQSGFSPRLGHTARHVLMLLQLVRMGLGVALAPRSLSNAGVDGVRFLNPLGVVGPVRLCAVWSKRARPVIQRITAGITAIDDPAQTRG